MKKSVLLLPLLALLASCTSNTYSHQLQEEKQLIKKYIESKNIHIIDTVPEQDYIWQENDYCCVSGIDNLYFHLSKQGDTTRKEIIVNEEVLLRYRKYTLTEENDIVESTWTTQNCAYPTKFRYLIDYTTACNAWHKAVGLMKYPGAECKIICPSKQGFSTDQNNVTPYGYDIKIQVER